MLCLGALRGSWLNTDSDSAWNWAWDSAFFFFFNVSQVMSMLLGPLKNPLLKMMRHWNLQIFWVLYSSNVLEKVSFSQICTREQFKDCLWLLKTRFFGVKYHLLTCIPSPSQTVCGSSRSSVDKNLCLFCKIFFPLQKMHPWFILILCCKWRWPSHSLI